MAAIFLYSHRLCSIIISVREQPAAVFSFICNRSTGNHTVSLSSLASCDGSVPSKALQFIFKSLVFRDSIKYIYINSYEVAIIISIFKGFDDLKGKTVGVKTGTQGATYAESLKDEYGFNITYYEDSPTMYQAVLGGQVVACFEDTPIMASSIKDGDLALQILEDTANEGSPYGFAIFDADNQELLDMFNAGLKDIKDSGEYNKIIAKYLGEDAVPTEEADADATETPAAEEEAAE